MKKKQKQAIVCVGRCMCKITPSANIKHRINQMLPNEMSTASGLGLWSFGVFGSDRLHLCFDRSSESDPDVVFNKNTIFSVFCSKCLFIYLFVWNPHSSVDKRKECIKLEYVYVCMHLCMHLCFGLYSCSDIYTKKYSVGCKIFVKMIKNGWKMLVGKELKQTTTGF